jgi:hypothetical protein
MYAHSISMSIFERLNRFNFEIYKISQKNVSLSTGTSPTTEKIISHKYATLTLNLGFETEWVGSTTRNLTF